MNMGIEGFGQGYVFIFLKIFSRLLLFCEQDSAISAIMVTFLGHVADQHLCSIIIVLVRVGSKY